MSYIQVTSGRDETQKRRIKRPLGVKIIVCLQLLKAAILLTTAFLLKLTPQAVTNSQSVFYPLLYIAMRGNASVVKAAMEGGDLLSGIILLLGLYMAATGIGLWAMQEWARRSVLFTSGMTLFLYAKSTFFPSEAAQGASSSASPDMLNFYILLALDAMMFVYFMRTNTSESFQNALEA